MLLNGWASQALPLSGFPAKPVPEWFRTGLTYQIMPRSMSEEGTLKGAEAHLERLQDLGVNTVYLLPVNEADTDMNKAFWSERQHKAGFDDPRNPYRAGDYFHVDPEYGTDKDLHDFVAHAHALGMKVLLDMVFLHCGPSAKVLKEHPDYFQRGTDGELQLGEWHFPIFDYGNPAARAYLKTVMAYYVADANVDGFRLDVADEIPLDFWEEAREMLDGMRPDLVLVAEGSRPENTLKAMDCNYNFPVMRELRRWLRRSFQGRATFDFSIIRKAHEDYFANCPQGTLLWNFSENHDTATDDYDLRMEKNWGYGCSTLLMAFCFALDGVPFLVNGQEICYDKRISLFGHKDCWIHWEEAADNPRAQERTEMIRRWVEMRGRYSALTHGQTLWLDNDRPAEVGAFLRRDGKSDDILFVGNFSDKKVSVKLENGQKFKLEPWAFIFKPIE